MDIHERIKKEFYEKYPVLFPGDGPMCGFSCEAGWFKLIDDLCHDLMQIIDYSDLPLEEKAFKVDQVKEKFGGLRFYISAVHESISEAVYKRVTEAEEQSFKTCEYCGSTGNVRNRLGEGFVWIKTRCDDCQKEFEKARSSKP